MSLSAHDSHLNKLPMTLLEFEQWTRAQRARERSCPSGRQERALSHEQLDAARVAVGAIIFPHRRSPRARSCMIIEAVLRLAALLNPRRRRIHPRPLVDPHLSSLARPSCFSTHLSFSTSAAPRRCALPLRPPLPLPPLVQLHPPPVPPCRRPAPPHHRHVPLGTVPADVSARRGSGCLSARVLRRIEGRACVFEVLVCAAHAVRQFCVGSGFLLFPGIASRACHLLHL